jgi:hypothetical protein
MRDDECEVNLEHKRHVDLSEAAPQGVAPI